MRELERGYAIPKLYETSFSDGYPFLITSEASLQDLSEKVGRDLSMKRFRPNIVLKGDMPPFEEDKWETLQIGDALFVTAKICGRCKVPTVNPDTGEVEADNQPTVALQKHRKYGSRVLFGQNAVCARGEGLTVQVNDVASVLSLHPKRKY